MQTTAKIIVNEFLYYIQEPNIGTISLWADELSNFRPEEIERAFKKMRGVSTKVPMPAQIKSELLGYLSADEAWNLIPRDEYASVVWNEPMRVAFGACRNLLGVDDFGARRAFVASYDAAVLMCKMRNEKPKWELSEGLDKTNSDSVLKNAYEKGWIKKEAAVSWSPDIAIDGPRQLQIEGPKETFTDEVREENLNKLRALWEKK